jgi:hypothetical protein
MHGLLCCNGAVSLAETLHCVGLQLLGCPAAANQSHVVAGVWSAATDGCCLLQCNWRCCILSIWVLCLLPDTSTVILSTRMSCCYMSLLVVLCC